MHRSRSTLENPVVVALMATRGRDHRFLDRSIGSIVSQSRLPDVLVVVVDSPDATVRDRVHALVRRLVSDRLRVVCLENERTRGAAGAWNTGLDWAHREWDDPTRVFVAVLDDDDAWEREHVRVCFDRALSDGLHQVAAGILRFECEDEPGRPQSIPTALDFQTLLATGQHIQGSNLFARLDVLLTAGAFDEQLASCTDRDLVARLALLEGFRFGSVERHTVRHYADPRADRCSAPGSRSKTDGLTAFHEKWRPLMSPETHAAFLARGSRVFQWEPARRGDVVPESSAAANEQPDAVRPVSLVVGIIVDPRTPARVGPLLDDLRRLADHPEVVGLDVLLLENGSDGAAVAELRALIHAKRLTGLRCFVLDRSQQEVDATSGIFGLEYPRDGQRLPIAVARTRIMVYSALHAQTRPGSWVWLLDDDARLGEIPARDGSIISPDLRELARLADAGTRIVYGSVAGAPPLPFVACLRTQSVDALHALLSVDQPTAWRSLDEVDRRRAELSASARDVYYDLSRRDTRLLETPFPLNTRGDTRATLLKRLAEELPRALAGEQVTRPLVIDERATDPDSIRRGPSALWFHPEDLLRVPNSIARIGDTFTRRSDMLVALVSRDVLGLKSVESPAIAIRQDRSDAVAGSDLEKLELDVLGYAFYSALADVFAASKETRRERRTAAALAFDANELRLAVHKFRKYVDERCFALSLSAWRLRGVASSARAWLSRVDLEREELSNAQKIVSTLESLARAVTPDAAENLRLACQRRSDAEIEHAFTSLATSVEAFQRAAGSPFDIRVRLHEQRVALAELAAVRTFGDRELRCLGAGAEGVALTDGTHALKVVDYWKARDHARAMSFLRSRVGQATESRALPAIEGLEQVPGATILVTPFVETEPYSGGCGPGLVRLLRDCRRLGIVCRNIHPKNVRVRGDDVILIDYGSDLRSFDKREFRHMAKRAWLTWRWSHRPDLAELMRRSIDDETLPELVGFDRLLAALEIPAVGNVLDPVLLEVIGETERKRVLDFGCGKGRVALRLAGAGADVTAYDPDTRHAERWAAATVGQERRLRFTSSRDEALAQGPFDTVVASLVLCEIGDELAYRRALDDIEAALAPDGTAVIAVCNPFATFGTRTPLHPDKRVPAGVTYDDVFVGQELVGNGREWRTEVHRPLHRLTRDLLRAGLRIESMQETRAVDLERFEPTSDFLVITARRVRRRSQPVSLVIKACPQEWRTIDAQVRHLVDALQDPVPFHEVVLAVDERTEGFPRAYTRGDLDAFRSAIERLQRAGYVDRWVVAPPDAERVVELNRRWFGIDSAAPHAANGQATVVALAAIESCTTPLVVQVDSDVMIARPDRAHDWLAPIDDVFAHDPSAVTASLSVAAQTPAPYASGAWRVETRASVLHRERMLSLRPLPNAESNGALARPWHRSLDEVVSLGLASSYRGADPKASFVHPANVTKRGELDWMLALDAIARGRVPAAQAGAVDMRGEAQDFLPRERAEPFVFVVTGRSVPPNRMRRCLESIVGQQRTDWGLVVFDDASDPRSAEYLELWCAQHAGRVTLVRPRLRRGLLANLNDAIRVVCTNPASVIVTVDLDDELLGPYVLDVVASHYAAGADVTVGSMLRTDKHVHYGVNFDAPRRHRGGNVWQHLRTFRKYLFDAITEDELRIDGEFVDLATDWAFMLPIIERAQNPVWIRRPLYLYEPSGRGKGEDRAARESVIATLCARSAVTTPAMNGAHS